MFKGIGTRVVRDDLRFFFGAEVPFIHRIKVQILSDAEVFTSHLDDTSANRRMTQTNQVIDAGPLRSDIGKYR